MSTIAADTGRPNDEAPLEYAGFDDPAFLDANTETGPDGERRVTLAIDGIHCAACIWLLERLPRIVPGVIEARVHWRRNTLAVVPHQGGGDRDRLAAQIELAQRIVREKPDDALLALRRMLGERRKDAEMAR